MRLFDELFGDATDGLTGARAVWRVGNDSYFEGVKSLLKFSSEEIVLATRAGQVRVQGKDLLVKKYADGDLHVGGKIYALSLPDKGKDC